MVTLASFCSVIMFYLGIISDLLGKKGTQINPFLPQIKRQNNFSAYASLAARLPSVSTTQRNAIKDSYVCSERGLKLMLFRKGGE